MSLTKEDQRKIINHGIHDMVNGTSIIKGYIEVANTKLKENSLTLEDLPKIFEKLLIGCNRVNDAGDYIYTKFKEDRDS